MAGCFRFDFVAAESCNQNDARAGLDVTDRFDQLQSVNAIHAVLSNDQIDLVFFEVA